MAASNEKGKISEILKNLTGLNSDAYLAQQRKSVAQLSNSTVKTRQRATQVPANSSFMTQDNSSRSRHVDTSFAYQKYIESVTAGNWVGRPNIPDRFRASAGLFWTDKTIQNTGYAATRKDLCYMVDAAKGIQSTHIPIKMHFDSLVPAREKLDSDETIEWVLIEANTSFYGQKSEFDSAAFKRHLDLAQFKTFTWQEDHTMSVIQLVAKSDVEAGNSGIVTDLADIHGDYNYYDGRYERSILSKVVPEATIPNMYVFFAFQDSPNPNPAFHQHLSLGNKIDLSVHQDVFNATIVAPQQATPTEKYFNDWSRAYAPAIADGTTVFTGEKFKNIMFSADDINTLVGYEVHKEMFPMWMHVEFTMDKMVEFSEALKDSQLMGILQQSLMSALRSGDSKLLTSERFFQAEKVDGPLVTAENVASTDAAPPKRIIFSSKNRRVFNLDRWMNDFLDDAHQLNVNNSSFDGTYSTFLGTFDSSEIISNDPKYRFYKSLMAVILKGKIRKLLKKHTRTVPEVLSGESCYHETVLYRISKYRGASASGELLQSYYVPNSIDVDVFRYMDTQVKYDTEYTYTINAYELVVGNRYSYGDVVCDGISKWGAVPVTNAPSLKLIEVPIYKYTNRVIDNPPIHPEVEFIPFKGCNNKIKILMNSGIGRYEIPIEMIESTEQETINKLKKAQNRKPADKKLQYETDDYPAFYEIFRMAKKPTSFADFSGKKRHNLSTTLKNSTLISSGVSVIDKIVPNKKYYYCIRSIDNHGHISYPSPIYQVEMVDDGGAVFPIIQLCEFAPKIESQPVLGGRRYIHIQPAMPQMLVNEEASGLLDAESVADLQTLALSISEEPLWGKKFKIRLTSKSTGRKMDFNVSFEHKHLKLESRD